MEIQEIDGLLDSFNEKAVTVREQLTKLLSTVSDGKVPSENLMETFNKEMVDLRVKYDGIYYAVKEVTAEEEIPEEGASVQVYVDAAKNSRHRLLKEKINKANVILEKFVNIKAKLDIYANALKPYQEAACELISQMDEENVQDIFSEIDGPKNFIETMEIEDKSSVECLELMRSVSQYYPIEIQMGLATNQFYLSNDTSGENITSLTDLNNKEKVENYTSNSNCNDRGSAGKEVNAGDESFNEVQSLERDTVKESIPCDISEGIENKQDTERGKITLKAVNKLKGGNPSASSFRKEITKIGKINKDICTVLPLMTNLGILTKEQCFLLSVCMDCNAENDQVRESISAAIDILAAKGYIANFECEINGEVVSAFCLTNYCNSCMRKESTAQMKDFWAVSFGNYKFVSDMGVAKDDLTNAINTNSALIKYIYSIKDTLSKEDFSVVKRSINWKTGYYQVTVFENGVPNVCHFVSFGEDITAITDANILLSTECCNENFITEADFEKVFIMDKGTVRHGKGNYTAHDVITHEAETGTNLLNGNESDEENVFVDNEEEKSTDEKYAIETIEQNVAVSEEEELPNECVVNNPRDLLAKAKTNYPTDEEFCYVIFQLLNNEATTQDQLRTTIINTVLLAYSAGLDSKYKSTSEISLQLRLATNVFIDASAYTSENFAMAFSDINNKNSAMALAASMFAMLVPAMPFDYGLTNQIDNIFAEYEKNFPDFAAFKALFNVLMSVKDASATGFSPATIALLGSEEESSGFIAELKKQAEQYLTVQTPKTRMKGLPVLYNDCFGVGSDLYECMKIIVDNKVNDFDFVQLTLSYFSDDKNGVYALDEGRIAERLDESWNEKNDFKLEYDAHGQALKQFRIRLEVMKEWVEIIDKSNSNAHDLSKLKKLKKEIVAIIHDLQKENSWRNVNNANVLVWALRYMQKYLSGELVKIAVYSDLLFTGIFGFDDEGIPVIDKSTVDIKFYEPWRNALRHITTIKKSADDIKAEIRGDVIAGDDEEAGLKDNLHQLSLLGQFLNSDDDDYLVSNDYIKEAISSADDRTTRFKESLELAYTYNQINETEKETLSGIMAKYQNHFYEALDFANWRRFLEALELQMMEYATGRKNELREKLDVRLEKNANSSLLKEADRLLEEDKNFSVTEEYLTRFDNGEIELEDEIILHDKDYFAEFLEPSCFDEIMNVCRKGKGRALKNFGWEYVEGKLPKDWATKNKEDSRMMVSNWPTRKDTVTESQIKSLFSCFDFTVTGAEKKQGYKEEVFQLSVTPTAKSMADYRHPIASFGTKIRNNISVILVDANYTPRQLVDSVASLDLGGISIVIYNQPMDAAGRRMMGEIFHTQTSGQNPFLLVDQVLFLYLAMHQRTERVPALLKCTLPYTTYQPFVRDGGSTADEMFCGRTQELATIIDPNGACVVYGGRQLGKTALLERAESRCSKPENKAFAVYSTIIRIDNEKEVVDTLVTDIERKTNGKVTLGECNTLKEMCSLLSRMFRTGQIATMYLFIDEVDCFLASIADKAYSPIQPLVDLKRETKNSFKFVLTGLHNVCRAKNATRDNGIFGQLGTPLCIKPLSPTDALKLLSRPLNYLGFQIERYPHLETILTNTNYYPGILQFFGYMLVETLTGQYSKYYSATEGNPPFSLQDEQLGAVMNSADLNKSIKDKFRWSLELDERYFMIARCLTMLYHIYEEEKTMGNWMGFKVEDIREIANVYKIHCLEHESPDSFINLLDEMVEMGILSQPLQGYYRLRRSSFVDIIGENSSILEKDIENHNGVIV